MFTVSVSLLISLPFAIYFRTVVNIEDGKKLIFCQDVWPTPTEVFNKASAVVVVFTSYVVPLTVIIFCYAMILNTLWKNKMTFGSNRVRFVFDIKQCCS